MKEQPEVGINTYKKQSLEKLKQIFSSKLQKIIFARLTPENILNFAQNALDELISLLDEVHQAMSQIENGNLSDMTEKEKEDYFLDKLGLGNVENVINLIIEKQEQIENIKHNLDKSIQDVNFIITPPDEKESKLLPGEKTEQDKRLIPRLLTLMYILEEDYEIDTTDISEVVKTRGIVSADMIRRTPYVRTHIRSLDRIVYTCDEEGNASYIFDLSEVRKCGYQVEEIDFMTKFEKNKLIEKNPGIGKRIRQTPNWRDNVSELLTKIPVDNEGIDVVEVVKKERRSEFIEFHFFVEDVRRIFNEQNRMRIEQGKAQITNIAKWYKKEQKKHKLTWPAVPDRTYQKYWNSWPDLVGRESKKFLSWDDFQQEVRRAFNEQNKMRIKRGETLIGEVREWYRKERKEHKLTWPAAPDETYQKYWNSWPDLVGRESKKFLSWDDFQQEVRRVFNEQNRIRKEQGKGLIRSIKKWYKEEQKKYKSTWPTLPDENKIYQKHWNGWLDLVGRESKKFLPWDDFQKEVARAFDKQNRMRIEQGKTQITNIAKWYTDEQKQHKSTWPVSPNKHKIYQKHWNGWLDLVGKIKIKKHEKH